MNMKIPITHEFLKEEFDCEDEELEETLSQVYIKLERDCHYDSDSLEMTIEVWEADNPFEAPIISEVISDPETYLGKNFYKHSVCPRCLLNLFDDNLINLIIRKKLKIIWNPDWQTEAIIDPVNLHQTAKLEAEER